MSRARTAGCLRVEIEANFVMQLWACAVVPRRKDNIIEHAQCCQERISKKYSPLFRLIFFGEIILYSASSNWPITFLECSWIFIEGITYYIKSNLTPNSLCMDKTFWFYGYFSEAVSFSKCATFSPESSLETAEMFCLTASRGTSCVDKRIIVLTLKRKTIWMKPMHLLRNFLGGGAGDVISIVVVNRDVVCVIIVMLSWKGAGWEN